MQQDNYLPVQSGAQDVALVVEPVQFDQPRTHDRFFEDIMEGFSRLAVELEKNHCPVSAIDFPNAPKIKQFSEEVSGLSLQGNIRLLAAEERFGVFVSTHNETKIGNWPEVNLIPPDSLSSAKSFSVDGKDYKYSFLDMFSYTVLDPKEPVSWVTKDGVSIVTVMRGLGGLLVGQPDVSDLTHFTGFTLTRNPPIAMQEPLAQSQEPNPVCASVPDFVQDSTGVKQKDACDLIKNAPLLSPQRGDRFSFGFLKKLFR